MEEQKKITLLGLGNILLQDEGFGVHFIRWIAQRHEFGDNLRIVDGGVLGYGLLHAVCSSNRIIAVDAIRTNHEPGSVFRFSRTELEPRMPEPASAHEVELLDVLFQAEIMGELPDITFLCIVPERCGSMGLQMTGRMTNAFPVMECLLLEELKSLGITRREVS